MTVYPGCMTRHDYKAFLVEYADVIFDHLLTTDSYLLDSVVLDELSEELVEWKKEFGELWEVS